MANADWWARVVQARTRHDDLLPQRVWTLRNGSREAAIDLRPVPGIGAEIVLLVDGEWRRTRLFRSHEQAELAGAIADTRATFEARKDGHEGLSIDRGACCLSELWRSDGCGEREARVCRL
jgi:hypothetical protein